MHRLKHAALVLALVLTARSLAQPTPLHIAFDGNPANRLLVQNGAFQTGKDKSLAAPFITSTDKTLLTLESPAPQEGPREIRALVRLRGGVTPNPTATFSLAKKDAKDPGLRMTLSTKKDGDAIACMVSQGGKPLHDNAALAEKLDWKPEFASSMQYFPRAYPLSDIRPGWDTDFRIRVELDMSQLPSANDKWLAVRIEVKPGYVRFWLDDRCIGHKSDPAIDAKGTTQITLAAGVQLAAYEVLPLGETPGFLPIRLDGYANGKLVGGSSVKPGELASDKITTVGGVPFVFCGMTPEGKDHIDVSKSFLRQANAEGYIQSLGHRWIGAARRDPARIQLRVPNNMYDALYVLAAATGEPNTIPQMTAMFYRPSAGFAENFETTVPLATADVKDTAKVPVTLANGKTINLWLVKIPLDPGRLSAFADMDIIEIELTKKVALYRTYPDPINYGWHQAGLPSSVHVFAATLGETPVTFNFDPDTFGHVWTDPEVPAYRIAVHNRSGAAITADLELATRSYDGTDETRVAALFKLDKNAPPLLETKKLPVKLNGYYDVTATLRYADRTWVEKRSFVRLAPDRRSTKWTPGKGALFGYWSYHGGHHTPKAEHHMTLMTLAGARTSLGMSAKAAEHPLVKKHWAPTQAGAWEVRPQPWAREEPYDPKKYADYQRTVIDAFKKHRAAIPPEYRPDHVYFFPEPHISSRLTEGNLSSYWGEPEPPLTDAEKVSLRMFFVTAKCAAEAVRKEFPELKILIPWGDPLFVPPLLRAGFPRELIDGSGLDVPGFERLPEMQLHQNAIHRLYTLRKEYEKAGIPKPQLQFVEGIFVPTEPGACSPREQMDIYTRWTLLSMGYGIDRFYSGWFAFDCGNYYGSEHYGGCGIQRRIPYCDPKPAYASYATMTDRLNEANFDGWVKTGSLTTFCLRFAGPRGKVYTLWTVRGRRPVTLTLAAEGEVHVTDSMNNTTVRKTKGGKVTIPTDPSVVYVTTSADLVSVEVDEPIHLERPASESKVIADLGDGTWNYTHERDTIYETGAFAIARYPGMFRATVAKDADHGKVLVSTLEKQDKVHELMPWYNTLAPKKKIVLPGAPSHLGLWVKGASDWGRVVYVLRDAKGEKWTSIGTQDQYNCDDIHSWSSFNFDGWRYLRFELPGHAGYDNFRKHGTTWWRGDGGDGIVDLPLALEKILVEQRSHILYVNDIQPVASNSVSFGKLFAEYADPADAAPLAVVHAKLRMPLPKGVPDLPNPIALIEKEASAEPTAIVKLEPPIEHNDGTLVHVHFKEVEKRKHFIWVGVRPDGKGAVNLTPAGAKNGGLVRGLRPALPLYFWVTYLDDAGNHSKPSPAVMATLVDTFSQK
jgi:hypothetical protein